MQIIWLMPLLILPGISLLIVSTASRFSSLHDEIHHWLDGNHDSSTIHRVHLITRATHFRNALVALYASVLILVCASLVGGAFDFLGWMGDPWVLGIVFLGMCLLSFAMIELIRESILSLQVIHADIEQMMEESK
ncbi:MAG: DUF2721 domain-containing protein [Phototrophicaceae bacterium]